MYDPTPYEPAQWLLLELSYCARGHFPYDRSSTDAIDEIIIRLGLHPGFYLLHSAIPGVHFSSCH